MKMKDKKESVPQNDPFKPSVSLLVKLGSVFVHAEEFLSSDGHDFDKVALNQLFEDAEVKEWVAAMDKMAFLPKKRK
jgi:hypothetical protein